MLFLFVFLNFWNVSRWVLAILASLGAGGYYYYYTHLGETPITKRKRFVIFSDEQIDEISRHELDIVRLATTS